MSLSATGTTLVAGTINSDQNAGSVRTYQLKNSNIYSYDQVGSDIVGETAGSQFGFAVSISGDGSVFVVGARYK